MAYGAGCRCSPSEPLKLSFSVSILRLPYYNPPTPSAAGNYFKNPKEKKKTKNCETWFK